VSERNKEIALQFMEAMSSNRPELADEVIGEGAIAIAKGYGKFAGSRPRETMVGGIEAFKSIIPTGLRFTIHSVTAEGERVIVEARGNAVTSTGVPYRNDYCFVITIRDGKIVLVNEYFCNVHADEVLWTLASADGGLQAQDG